MALGRPRRRDPALSPDTPIPPPVVPARPAPTRGRREPGRRAGRRARARRRPRRQRPVLRRVLARPPVGADAGHARPRTPRPSSRSGTRTRAISDRYAGGDVDRKSLVEGAIKGMIGSLDDPYSQYLTSEEFKSSLEGISGQFEGIGATIGTVERHGRDRGLHDAGRGLLPRGGRAADGVAGREGRPAPGRRDRRRSTARPCRGLTVDEARGKVRGPKDTTVKLTDPARGRRHVRGRDHARGHRPARGGDRRPRQGHGGLHQAGRLLGPRGDRVPRGGPRTPSGAASSS